MAKTATVLSGGGTNSVFCTREEHSRGCRGEIGRVGGEEAIGGVRVEHVLRKTREVRIRGCARRVEVLRQIRERDGA